MYIFANHFVLCKKRINFLISFSHILQKLEEQFALQLEEQEAIYGPSAIPLCLPADLPDLTHHTTESTRSSLSSVSEG